MNDFKPTLSELYAESLCPECGEQLDFDGTCCSFGCVAYERAMGRSETAEEIAADVEAFGVLAHARDTRGGFLGFEDESEVA